MRAHILLTLHCAASLQIARAVRRVDVEAGELAWRLTSGTSHFPHVRVRGSVLNLALGLSAALAAVLALTALENKGRPDDRSIDECGPVPLKLRAFDAFALALMIADLSALASIAVHGRHIRDLQAEFVRWCDLGLIASSPSERE